MLIPTKNLLVSKGQTKKLKKSIDVMSKGFHPLQALSRYHDPQLQVGKNYTYLLYFIPKISKSSCLNSHFIPNNSDLIG